MREGAFLFFGALVHRLVEFNAIEPLQIVKLFLENHHQFLLNWIRSHIHHKFSVYSQTRTFSRDEADVTSALLFAYILNAIDLSKISTIFLTACSNLIHESWQTCLQLTPAISDSYLLASLFSLLYHVNEAVKDFRSEGFSQTSQVDLVARSLGVIAPLGFAFQSKSVKTPEEYVDAKLNFRLSQQLVELKWKLLKSLLQFLTLVSFNCWGVGVHLYLVHDK